MELIDVINGIVARTVNSMQPTDMVIGTVQSISPLSVKLESGQAVIEASVLYRTDAVVERKIKVDTHSHSYSDGTTGPAKSTVTSYVDGKALPAEGGYIILNKGLSVGDKVLLLSVNQGQKFVILSHLT